MLFNSGEFLIFFPIVVLVDYLIPQKGRYIWLLIASYYFYMQWNPIYVLLLLMSTVITYAGGLILEHFQQDTMRKSCLFVVIVINLSVLAYFKYSNMFVEYYNVIARNVGINTIPWDYSIVLPVGISFFTLQALGYLIDVYRKDIYAEHNIFRYALFISFFPQLVAGPIERSKNLLKQLANPKGFSYDNMRKGLLLMLYGFFLKLVIADRVSIFVDAVYNNPGGNKSLYIGVATVMFAIQIYCDFYGYSTIARGAALVMGIRLMDNFNAPYYSKSIQEFWRRWHVSLSTWFRDYLYIPLGGNRKGLVRKNINVLIVFAVSGLWHGASMAFVTWGLLHGIYQLIESFATKKDKRKNYINDVIHMTLTFVLTCFAWIFFRANNIFSAKQIFTSMINPNINTNSFWTLGISREYWIVVLLAIIVLAFIDWFKYKGIVVVDGFYKLPWCMRTVSFLFLCFMIIMFGAYGAQYDTQQFIYFQF